MTAPKRADTRPTDHQHPLPASVIARCAEASIAGPTRPWGVQ